MGDSVVSQAQLNKLAEMGVGKLASKVGLKNADAISLAHKYAKKGAGLLGKLASKKLRAVTGMKKGGTVQPAKRGPGRPKGSTNKKGKKTKK